MPEADKAALAGENNRLSASGAYRNNPHSPPRSGTWTVECRRRRAVEALHARRPEWRPPGRAVCRPGAPRRIEPNSPDDHRRPFERHKCHGRSLSELCAFGKQVAEIERDGVSRRNSDACDGVPRMRSGGRRAARRDAEEHAGGPAGGVVLWIV